MNERRHTGFIVGLIFIVLGLLVIIGYEYYMLKLQDEHFTSVTNSQQNQISELATGQGEINSSLNNISGVLTKVVDLSGKTQKSLEKVDERLSQSLANTNKQLASLNTQVSQQIKSVNEKVDNTNSKLAMSNQYHDKKIASIDDRLATAEKVRMITPKPKKPSVEVYAVGKEVAVCNQSGGTVSFASGDTVNTQQGEAVILGSTSFTQAGMICKKGSILGPKKGS